MQCHHTNVNLFEVSVMLPFNRLLYQLEHLFNSALRFIGNFGK